MDRKDWGLTPYIDCPDKMKRNAGPHPAALDQTKGMKSIPLYPLSFLLGLAGIVATGYIAILERIVGSLYSVTSMPIGENRYTPRWQLRIFSKLARPEFPVPVHASQ